MRRYFRDRFGLRKACHPPSEPIDPVGGRAPSLHSGIRGRWLLPVLAVLLLAVAPAGQALDLGEGPVLILAREVRVEPRLLADQVRFDQGKDQIEALGNIALIEPSGEVLYADRIVLSGDLRNGVASQLRARLQDDSLLASAEGRRIEGTRTEMDQVV